MKKLRKNNQIVRRMSRSMYRTWYSDNCLDSSEVSTGEHVSGHMHSDDTYTSEMRHKFFMSAIAGHCPAYELALTTLATISRLTSLRRGKTS